MLSSFAYPTDARHLHVRIVSTQEFKAAAEAAHALENYLRQVEVAAIAQFLAKEYCRQRRPAMKIRFLSCHVAECRLPGVGDAGRAGEARRYNVEPPLPDGEFVKYCNNLGFWDLDRADRCLADFCR